MDVANGREQPRRIGRARVFDPDSDRSNSVLKQVHGLTSLGLRVSPKPPISTGLSPALPGPPNSTTTRALPLGSTTSERVPSSSTFSLRRIRPFESLANSCDP